MINLRPRTERGKFNHPQQVYGQSYLGAPLLYFPAQVAADETDRPGMVMAGTHGDEVAAVVALSCALRSIPPDALRHHVILAVNPDGCQLGQRCNARGVDLNRNFATSNWQQEDTVYRWNSAAEERDVLLSTGSSGGSEAETRALCELIARLQPGWIVTIHEPLACIEDPATSELGQWLAEALALPLVSDVGYLTPGSFGTWCAEQDWPCITVEFPPISADAASEDYLEALIRLLTH